MHKEFERPFTFDIVRAEDMILSAYDHHISRRLSAMQGQYLDQQVYEAMLAEEETLI